MAGREGRGGCEGARTAARHTYELCVHDLRVLNSTIASFTELLTVCEVLFCGPPANKTVLSDPMVSSSFYVGLAL
eukprot:2549372-Pyramimonas_sp.AAC.1